MINRTRPTWLEIDCSAIVHNVGLIRAMIGNERLLMAVVKANAYGHGAGLVAAACMRAGADRFAVATVAEAIELRNLNIHVPIHVLGYVPVREAEAMVAHDIIATVFDWETAQALNQAAHGMGRTARVHVKVNTGMNRLGVTPQAAISLLGQLQRLSHVEVEGIFTHFAAADVDAASAQRQFTLFSELLAALAQVGLRPPLAHAANSAATLAMPQTHLEMVRCGIALYGLHPDVDGVRLPAGFRPVLSWKAEIAQVFDLQPGDGVSYGHEFVAAHPVTAAVIPVGYADGFPRRPRHWQSVLVHGTEAPILGRVCMDQTIVDVSAAAQVAPIRQGDEVVLIGRQGTAALTAETVAARLETINYDVVSRILARVPRLVCAE